MSVIKTKKFNNFFHITSITRFINYADSSLPDKNHLEQLSTILLVYIAYIVNNCLDLKLKSIVFLYQNTLLVFLQRLKNIIKKSSKDSRVKE